MLWRGETASGKQEGNIGHGWNTDGTRMDGEKDGAQQELSTLRSRATAEDGRPTRPTDGLYGKLQPSRGPRNLRLTPISSSFFAKLPTVG